ncbi:hypothetical protein C812_02055 [Paenibacillus barengoltzii G22]|uniref:Uncharacterized protein n=1 Tax=Paenibacillus barengoltzii G22 TaxID=1235795 RepID=R9LL58_9BACL|nr:hypothetical protein C812_02055 [Paenibacillus barengoltzii G22]
MAAPQVVGIEHVSGDGGVELKYFTKAMYEQMQIRGLHDLSLVAGGVNIE